MDFDGDREVEGALLGGHERGRQNVFTLGRTRWNSRILSFGWLMKANEGHALLYSFSLCGQYFWRYSGAVQSGPKSSPSLE